MNTLTSTRDKTFNEMAALHFEIKKKAPHKKAECD